MQQRPSAEQRARAGQPQVAFSSPHAFRRSLVRQRGVEDFCDHSLALVLAQLLQQIDVLNARQDPNQSLDKYLDALLLAFVPSAEPFDSCEAFLSHLRPKHETSRSACGYLFGLDDIAFNCRTCQFDDTCVQCMKCFENSNHEGHDVYFHRTSPGGMCDCGDPEAWKPEGFCVHHRGLQKDEAEDADEELEDSEIDDAQGQDKEEQLPRAMRHVARGLFRTIVALWVDMARRAMDMFDAERVAQEGQRIAQLRGQDASAGPTIQFHVRIHNDDVHSDEDLVRSLQKKSIPDAPRLVKAIDANGSDIVLSTSHLRQALALMNELVNEMWHVCVVSDVQIAQENALIQVIRWVKRTCGMNSQLHRLFGQELFSKQNQRCAPKEPISVLFLADPYLRKEIVLELYQLYLGLQGDRKLKMWFSRVFMSVYSRLMGRYFCGVGTAGETLFHYGVQIFTTPSVVKRLLGLGLLESLFGALYEALDIAKTSFVTFLTSSALGSLSDAQSITEQVGRVIQQRNCRVLDPGHALIKYRRYSFVVDHLGFVLNVGGIVQDYALLQGDNLCKWFCCLSLLQGLNVQLRIQETQEHIAYEQQSYLASFTLHFNITKLSMALAKGLRKCFSADDTKETAAMSYPGQALEQVIQHVMNTFWQHLEVFSDSMPMVLEVPTYGFLFSNKPSPIVRYDISAQPVGLHYPLHHQFALFAMELLYGQPQVYGSSYDWKRFFDQTTQPFGEQVATELIWCLLEYPLRALMFCSQIQSGLWLRNGRQSMTHQVVHYYNSHYFIWGSNLRDMDVFLVQLSGLVLGFDTFLSGFFDRSDLLPWLFGTGMAIERFHVSHLAPDKMIPLLEETLLKLIWLVTELPMDLESLSKDDALLRREVVHRLSFHSSKRSELLDHTAHILQTPAGRISPITSTTARTTPDESTTSTSTSTATMTDHLWRLDRILQQVARVVSKADTSLGAFHLVPNRSNEDLAASTESSEDASAIDQDSAMAPNKYELTKEAFANEYDPAFYHLSRPDHEKAQTRRQDALFRFWKAEDTPIPLISQLPRAHGSFTRFRLVLLEKSLLGILRLLLEDATLSKPRKTSVLVIMRVLHLLNLVVLVLKEPTLAVSEQQRKQVLNVLRSGREVFEESSLRREKKRFKQSHGQNGFEAGSGSGDYGSNGDPTVLGSGDVRAQSIIELLVVLVKDQSANDFRSLKWSISAIYWILKELAVMDDVIDSYLKRSLWVSEQQQGEQSAASAGMSKAQLKKMHQQRAIQAMLARQKAFAQSHLADLEMEESEEQGDSDAIQGDDDMTDVNEESAAGEEKLKPLPAPDCIICSQVEESEPVMYIGHAQTSQVYWHALHGEARSNFDKCFARPQLYVQLCGHAVHLNCWRKYFDAMYETAHNAGEHPPMNIAYDAQLGEFLCPLCQSLSSILVPYVETRRVACAQTRKAEKQAMERVFQTKQDPTSVLDWLSSGLIERLKSPRLPQGPQVAAQRRAMAQFGRSIRETMHRFKSVDHMSVPVGLMTGAYQAHLIWCSIASTYQSVQLSGISSSLFCTMDHGSHLGRTGGSTPPSPQPPSTTMPSVASPPNMKKSSSTTANQAANAAAGSLSSLRLTSILNPPFPSLASRLAVNLPESLEQHLENCFTSKDDYKMNCVLRSLRLIPLLYDTNKSFMSAVCEPLAENFEFRLTKPTWIQAVENDAPLVLGLPILSQDLMHLMVVICGLLDTKAEIVLTMRCFCVLHMAQVLLQCSQLEGEDSDSEDHEVSTTDKPREMALASEDELDTEGKLDDDQREEEALEELLETLCQASGLGSTSTVRPRRRQLRLLFESSCLVFMRQVTLCCRAVFRGGENDPEASLYANFVNNLRLSTNFRRMSQQLGLPTVSQIVQDAPLTNYLSQAAHQLRTNGFGFVHAQPQIVDSNYFAGFAEQLLQALHELELTPTGFSDSSLATPSEALLVHSNLQWMPPLPINRRRQFEEIEDHHDHPNRIYYYFAKSRLVKLPRLFTDLHVKYIGRKCVTKGILQENPAICMLCEQVICGGSDCCRRQRIGACTNHAIQCGDGLGMFFLLRTCSILLMFGGRSCYFASPYVDMFGEEDFNLRRGRPLFLNQQRMRILLSMVAGHHVAQEVTRKRRTSERYIPNNVY